VAGFIKVVLPTILLKTDFEKNFIEQEAKAIMTSVAMHCSIAEVVDVLVEGCRLRWCPCRVSYWLFVYYCEEDGSELLS